MQYQSSLSRAQLIELATVQYFGSVDARNLDAAMACFHEEALFTIQTAHTLHAGKPAIARMLRDFIAAYRTIIHRDFVCTVDPDNGRIAASFVAELVDHQGATTLLHNTNFWRVRGERFQEVYVYMSGVSPLV
jgi:hypothetical protein